MGALNESDELIFATINAAQRVSLFDVEHRLTACGHPSGRSMDKGPQSNISE